MVSTLCFVLLSQYFEHLAATNTDVTNYKIFCVLGVKESASTCLVCCAPCSLMPLVADVSIFVCSSYLVLEILYLITY